MDRDRTDFSSPEEEAAYWKGLAHDLKLSLEDAREELDEFQASSRELETELETQIQQYENKNRELTNTNARLLMDNDNLREKLVASQETYRRVSEELQTELTEVSAFKDELQRYIRELEQTNDDLERAKRATVVSLEDFEGRLNLAIERNAFLESELDEKESLAITVQRLKDEARDLRQELEVKVTPSDEEDGEIGGGEPSKPKPKLVHSRTVDGVVQTDMEHSPPSGDAAPTATATTPPLTPSGKGVAPLPLTPGSSPLTTSARISALNIVGDLLRKVGALESKLASCRNFVKDQPGSVRNGRIGTPSPLHSPRAKRLNRGASTPSSLKIST